MYWPIGAPRIYAASNRTPPEESLVASDDGADTNSAETAREEWFSEKSEAVTKRVSVDDEQVRVGSNKVDESRGRTQTADGPTRLTSESPTEDKKESDYGKQHGRKIVALRVSRNGHMFATISASTLTIWQTRPTAILASVVRSPQSIRTYGPSINLLVRPDSAIYVVQTSLGYLITYSLATDPNSKVYKPQYLNGSNGHQRRHSMHGYKDYNPRERFQDHADDGGIREVNIRFRMVIKIDAGVVRALALDEELVVATHRPAAIQCIRWTPDSTGSQTSTELLNRMPWIAKKSTITDMIHDRPMNLSAWIMNDGKAYAVQRVSGLFSAASKDLQTPKPLFRGYCFHTPQSEEGYAVKAAINARFSLIAVGCANNDIYVYSARDYVGNIPISHRLALSVSSSTSGRMTYLNYSPDGYCLFAGYERGWASWSVYGKAGGNSFVSDSSISESNEEGWLTGVTEASWISGGAEILLLGPNDDRLWVLEVARSAVAGCFSSANISRSLLQTNTGFMAYRGHEQSDLTTISADASLWNHVQIPSSYLEDQWPIRSAVISPDGRYVAVAGRRGLAHYSVHSGRWKTFVDRDMEEEFVVRGGMCWHQHILIAAVEFSDYYEIRLYSRELSLDNTLMLHAESLPAPAVIISLSGEDSLLVYTYDNILYHYIIVATAESIRLVQVGQIAFHGIIRAPARVRAISWVLPDDQIQNGEPAQDVAVATVLFLVDGKLVLLQPSTNDAGELKYDMKIIAQNVEYYVLMRDQLFFQLPESEAPSTPPADGALSSLNSHGLRDSLWLFDGRDVKVWPDVLDVLRSASIEPTREPPSAVKIPVDFYPLSVLLSKGIILGVEPELIQRRDINFAFFRLPIRTHLFLPRLMRYYLSQYNSPAALHLSHFYAHLLYFPHALEMLLHDVLDDEVDNSKAHTPHNSATGEITTPPPPPLLPTVLTFLSSFPQYLDILIQCTRKTELRSWRTLFAHLPPPQQLFEESLQKGALKTAGGYLLVLHTFEELGDSSQQLVRLLRRAKEEGDWELCMELARFLKAVDESGDALREALERVGLRSPAASVTTPSGSFVLGGGGGGGGRGRGSAGDGGGGFMFSVPRSTSSESEESSPLPRDGNGLGVDMGLGLGLEIQTRSQGRGNGNGNGTGSGNRSGDGSGDGSGSRSASRSPSPMSRGPTTTTTMTTVRVPKGEKKKMTMKNKRAGGGGDYFSSSGALD
ncbi:MAG: hypothetical protein M1819_000278 [Sarea resinae]|nr:MAG: hypothetical protein M1819_000278 [Sarea resinae]